MFAQLLYGGDDVSGQDWDSRHWEKQSSVREKLFWLAVEAWAPDASGACDELVLVAHSSGGLELPSIVAGLGASRIRAIVLNAASVPPEGGNGFDCMQPRHRELALQALAAADAEGTAIVTPVPKPESMRTSSG